MSAFRSQRLPLTPRTQNTPYMRPHQSSDSNRIGTGQNTGITPRQSHGNGSIVTPNTSTSGSQCSGGTNQRLSDTQKTIELCHKVLEEVRRGREDIRRLAHGVSQLEEEYKKLNEHVQQQNDASFTIESSAYKDDMVKEIGTLFVKSLQRQPSRQDVGQAILKVLRSEGRNKVKFNKAKTFCFNRLTDLRCEERRRLFGIKPCESFTGFSTEEFADRFMNTIKAPEEARETYIMHLALLRKFGREFPGAKNDTFKKFREWLTENFSTGIPNEEQWQQILDEDSHLSVIPTYDRTLYDNGGSEEFVESDTNLTDNGSFPTEPLSNQ